MVIMASGIARVCVRTTTAATESRNMAAKHQIYETCSLGLPCTSLILDIHVMLNWHLSIQGIRWAVLRGHIARSSWELIVVTCFLKVDRWPSPGFFIGPQAHVLLKQGQVVHNASFGLKVNRIIPNYYFIFYTNVFPCSVWCTLWLLKLKTLPYPALALNNPALELSF